MGGGGWTKALLIANIIIFTFYHYIGTKIDEKPFLVYLVLFSVVLRILSVLFFKTVQISDFAIPHNLYLAILENKQNGVNALNGLAWYVDYYSRFPAWYAIFKIVGFVYNTFGYNPEMLKYIIIVINAATIVIFYYAVKEFLNERIAKISAMVFSLSPSLIVYTSAISPDHFALFFISLLLLFWSKMYKYYESDAKKTLVYIVLISISAGLINLFKPIAIYYLIAFVCTEIVIYIFPSMLKWKDLQCIVLKRYKYWISFSLIFIIAYSSINRLNVMSLEKNLDTKVANSTYMYLLWAYAVDENGNYNSGVVSDEVNEVLKNHRGDAEAAMEEFKVMAQEQFAENIELIPRIIWQKLTRFFISEYGYYGFVYIGDDDEYTDAINKIASVPLVSNMMFYMFVIFSLSIMAVILNIIFFKNDKVFMLMFFMVLGYTLILLLGGIQGRYKCIILPQLAILASYGIDNISRLANGKNPFRRKNNG